MWENAFGTSARGREELFFCAVGFFSSGKGFDEKNRLSVLWGMWGKHPTTKTKRFVPSYFLASLQTVTTPFS